VVRTSQRGRTVVWRWGHRAYTSAVRTAEQNASFTAQCPWGLRCARRSSPFSGDIPAAWSLHAHPARSIFLRTTSACTASLLPAMSPDAGTAASACAASLLLASPVPDAGGASSLEPYCHCLRYPSHSCGIGKLLNLLLCWFPRLPWPQSADGCCARVCRGVGSYSVSEPLGYCTGVGVALDAADADVTRGLRR
jgi:hypothetical protein